MFTVERNILKVKFANLRTLFFKKQNLDNCKKNEGGGVI